MLVVHAVHGGPCKRPCMPIALKLLARGSAQAWKNGAHLEADSLAWSSHGPACPRPARPLSHCVVHAMLPNQSSNLVSGLPLPPAACFDSGSGGYTGGGAGIVPSRCTCRLQKCSHWAAGEKGLLVRLMTWASLTATDPLEKCCFLLGPGGLYMPPLPRLCSVQRLPVK